MVPTLCVRFGGWGGDSCSYIILGKDMRLIFRVCLEFEVFNC